MTVKFACLVVANAHDVGGNETLLAFITSIFALLFLLTILLLLLLLSLVLLWRSFFSILGFSLLLFLLLAICV